MKKIVLFTAASGLFYLSLSSNAGGPAAGGLNATGSPGTSPSCGGCHAGGTGTTTATVELRKLSTGPTGPVVTSYLPDTNYLVKVVGNHPTLTHFGFQVTALNSANANAGVFSDFPVNVHSAVVNAVTIIEHTDQLPKTNNEFNATFRWKAPAPGSGAVTFYGIINAVDNNTMVSGDRPSPGFTVAVAEATTASIGTAASAMSIRVFPNPVTTELHLALSQPEQGSYQLAVYDVRGKCVYNSALAVAGPEDEWQVNTADWACGLYHVHLWKEGTMKTALVVKQ